MADPRHVAAIRRAYADTRPHVSSDAIGFEMLRDEAGLTKAQFDAAIKSMMHDADVYINSEADQKSLSQAQRSAAVTIGNQPRHYLSIAGGSAAFRVMGL